ncbi:hypothetical protein V865_007190 [Kwoniella europaea PYCC6329]|uniref:Myb-like domain-containing protein n=1 Tax=Kwoniella europaea PYCC6329 TaxID=1423913 RepID=A0AAX4KU10_9TREE
MPKTPRSPTSSSYAPYHQPSSPLEDIKPNSNAAKSPKKSRTSSGRQPWTNHELLQLFEHVMKNGAGGKKVWESAVEGRTANQAYLAWQQTLAPFLRSAIETRRGR